ncbi:MAG: hypothetical protein IAE94_06920 [Chthoniobacterales bacterium]|nr:hypothetical protein [Chthoniobacterales bacterium]
MKLAAMMFFLAIAVVAAADTVETLRLQPAPNMTRAELHYVQTVSNPKAVLVLCPGVNGDGERLIRSPKWLSFAKENNLGLVGLSFASPMSAINDGTGYYYVNHGSGEKLLEGIRKIYRRELPLLFYGTSGGAHFTSRFVEWNPKKVLAWTAYSAGWWDQPGQAAANPPGIVACGDEDHRYGASLIYFKQGRAAGKPWLWVSLPRTGHTGSSKLDQFVMHYFTTILQRQFGDAAYLDIDQKTVVSESDADAQPSLTAWLPSRRLLNEWREIHEP